MNDLDTTASVGAAQATVDDGGEDVNNIEINDLRRQIDALRALLNARVETTAAVGREMREQSDSVHGGLPANRIALLARLPSNSSSDPDPSIQESTKLINLPS